MLSRLRALRAEGRSLRGLPPRVALFLIRARRLARRSGDPFSGPSHTRPGDVRVLLEAARGSRAVAELGTGTAWTAIALALADPRRTVVSYDPVVRLERDRYLGLVPLAVRARIDLRTGPAEDGPEPGARYGLVFLDSSHEREETLRAFRAWRPALGPGGVMALHDFANPDFPGVADAVAELGLDGRALGMVYLWRAPAG